MALVYNDEQHPTSAFLIFPGPKATHLQPITSKLIVKDVPREMRKGMFGVYLLPYISQLTCLSIVRCGLEDTGLMRLLIALRTTNLKELYLRENLIGAAGIFILCTYLRKSEIVKLDLSYNHFGAEGVYLILGNTLENNRLECLNINFNRVDFHEPLFGRHVQILLQRFLNETKLLCLEIEGIGGDHDFWKNVIKFTATNTHLERITLSRNVARKLLRGEAIENNKILWSFGPSISEGKGPMADMLRANRLLWLKQHWTAELHYRMNEWVHQMIVTSLLCTHLPIEIWKQIFGCWTYSNLF